ncbi:MAG: GDSL-type esterase/lipase family protein [Frankiaceae bacterium]
MAHWPDRLPVRRLFISRQHLSRLASPRQHLRLLNSHKALRRLPRTELPGTPLPVGRVSIRMLSAAVVGVAGVLALGACGDNGSPGPVITHAVDVDPGGGAVGPAAGQAPGRDAIPGPSPQAVVSLGDSYISGEAGRWAGNSPALDGTEGGTDRACPGGACTVPRPDVVYLDGSETNGCHRSDVAEIRSAAIPGAAPVNLACSGATTSNLMRAASGGHSQNRVPPQDDQLAAVARDYDIRLVVVSIGGNDLGFGQIMADCFLSYLSPQGCHTGEQAVVEALMPEVTARVGAALDDIRAVLAAAGQQPGSYRLILQSYPAPVPRAAENRYAAVGVGRTVTGGCPISNSDLNWARDRFVPQLSDGLKAAAAQKHAQFLDLRDAFQGREACSKASELVHGTPSAARDEWVRSTLSLAQGSTQEIMHPNAFGQQALGRCLALLANKTGPSYACHNSPGRDESAMTLSPS